LEKDRLYFKGVGGSDKKTYEVEMKFFKEIVPEKSKYAVRPMHIEFALEKVCQFLFLVKYLFFVLYSLSC
jgi:prostaglandin-E synthase